MRFGIGRPRRSGKAQAAESRAFARARGQALVEFALVAPIMVLIFAGLVQFAFIYERQIGIENAVRDGARRAATYTTDSTNVCSGASARASFIWNLVFGSGGLMQTNVEGYDGLKAINPLVTYSNTTTANGHTGVLVKVSVTYAHPLFLPLITPIIDGADGTPGDNDLRISTSSQFTVQNDADSDSSVGGTVVYPGC